jgi:hypothetical protein
VYTSPEKHAQLCDRLRPILKRKYRGHATRIEFEKPRHADKGWFVVAKRPFQDGRDDREAADDLVRRLGLRPLGHEWLELSPAAAHAQLAYALGHTLLYEDVSVPPQRQREADEIAALTLALLPGARRFTNERYPPPRPSRILKTITRSLFDTGILMTDPEHVVFMWVQEND